MIDITMVALILGAVLLGSIISLVGGMLGAYAVFKTKREPYESFLGGNKEGKTFNLDDGLDFEEDTGEKPLPEPTGKANNNFVAQFAEKLIDKAVPK